MFITIIATVFVLGILIIVHELGHFAFAKMLGMRVDEFAIGFGPKAFSRKYGETIYSLRIVPLGGFNKIAGMDPEEEQDERSFNAKPIWSRMLVIVAGSAMNLLLPILLFSIVFLSVGIDTPSDEPVLGELLAGKPAIEAGMATGDRILLVNGGEIESWKQFVASIQSNGQNPLVVRYERGGAVNEVTVQPEYDERAKRSLIGIMPEVNNYRPGVLEAVGLSVKHTFMVADVMLRSIGQMITGRAAADVAGPIGVAQMAGEVASMGFMPLLQFTALFSINLGLLNLFPMPVLDGGYVVALALEGIRGKSLSKEKMQYLQMVGFALLMLLMVFATFKDITRLKLF
ncbi:MAG: RIP metalloprotease RseP [Pelosinus sp.]|nr:RIP metalloprotease RseP [Pelosinus sp.]